MKIVKDIMSTELAYTSTDSSLFEIAKLMVDCDCGEIPLIDDEKDMKLVGVITDRDIVCRSLGMGKNPAELKAADCMTFPVITGDVDMTINDCIEVMEEHKIRRLPIVDEDNKFCGMLTQADILRNLEDDTNALEFLDRVSSPTEKSSNIATH